MDSCSSQPIVRTTRISIPCLLWLITKEPWRVATTPASSGSTKTSGSSVMTPLSPRPASKMYWTVKGTYSSITNSSWNTSSLLPCWPEKERERERERGRTTDPWVACQTLELAHLSGQGWLVWSSVWVVTVNVTSFSRISQILSPQDRQGNSNFSLKKVNFHFTSNNNQRRLGPQSLYFSFSLSLPPQDGILGTGGRGLVTTVSKSPKP